MAQRRTHCPAGRPLYRHGEIPETLATQTMLRRIRRLLATGQKPVATYWTGREYAPLYETAASAEMPALSPGRAAARAAARTCPDCGKTRVSPFVRGVDGVRRCDDHLEPAAEAWWHARVAAGRAEAAQWAAGVLADQGVLLARETMTAAVNTAHVETLDGTVLLSATHWTDPPSLYGRLETRAPAPVEPADLVDRVQALVGRRIIGPPAAPWWSSTLGTLIRAVERVASIDGDLTLRPGDDAERHLAAWFGEYHQMARYVDGRTDPYRDRLYRDGRPTQLRRAPIPGDPAAGVAFLRAALVAMAAAAEEPDDGR